MNPSKEQGTFRVTTIPGKAIGRGRQAPPSVERGREHNALRDILIKGGLVGILALAAGSYAIVRSGDHSPSQKTEVSRSFDPTLDKGTIGPSNTIFVTQEELKNYPDFDEKGNPLIVVAVSKDREIVFKRDKINPNTNDVKNVLSLKGIPAGEDILAPHDGHMFSDIDVVVDLVGKETTAVQGFKVVFLNPDGNWDFITVLTLDSNGMKVPAQALVSAPDWGEASVSKTSALTSLADLAAKGVVVQRGDPVLRTTQTTDARYIASAISSDNKNLGKDGYRSITPLTTNSNSTTELKLVAVE